MAFSRLETVWFGNRKFICLCIQNHLLNQLLIGFPDLKSLALCPLIADSAVSHRWRNQERVPSNEQDGRRAELYAASDGP